jgi:hypothetical protein
VCVRERERRGEREGERERGGREEGGKASEGWTTRKGWRKTKGVSEREKDNASFVPGVDKFSRSTLASATPIKSSLSVSLS